VRRAIGFVTLLGAGCARPAAQEPPPRTFEPAHVKVVVAEPPVLASKPAPEEEVAPEPAPRSLEDLAWCCEHAMDESCRDVHCNPPPPPHDLAGTIISTEATAGGTIVTINLGTRDGVTTGMTGILVDRAGAEVEGSSFTVIKVRDRACYARVELPRSTVEALDVRLEPSR
jgi:hypothetical protein